MVHVDTTLLEESAIGFAVAYAFGFERQLRGSPAGDRTFALVGAAAAAVTATAGKSSPQAVAGILTGLGFLGGAVVLRQGGDVRGLTTAASLFAIAGIGIVIGYGHPLAGILIAAVLLILLELQHIPFLRVIDANGYAERFEPDRAFRRSEPTGAADRPPVSPAVDHPAIRPGDTPAGQLETTGPDGQDPQGGATVPR